MLNVTVKTLDGRDHKFSVGDEMGVAEFKTHIVGETGVAADRQRLIFRGHVIQDDRKLKEIGVNENVLHLVERLPPSERVGRGGAEGEEEGGRTDHYRINQHFPVHLNNFTLNEVEDSVRNVLRRVGADERNYDISTTQDRGGAFDTRIVLRSAHPQVETPARARVIHIRSILRHINHILHHLEEDTVEEMPEGRVEEVDSGITVVPPECEDVSHEGPKGPAKAESSDSGLREPERAASADSMPSLTGDSEEDTENERMRHASVQDLTDVLGEILQVQDRIRPHLNAYHQMLANEQDYTNNTAEGRRVSRFFNGIQVAVHNLSHVLHVFSDLNIHFCEPPPRHLYPQFVPHTQRPDAASEVQINLRFQTEPAIGFHIAPPQPPPPPIPQPTNAPSVSASGTTIVSSSTTTTTTTSTTTAQHNTNAGPNPDSAQQQPQNRRFTFPLSSHNNAGENVQGLVSMSLSPNGSMVINGVTVTTSDATTPTTSQPQSGTSSSGGASGSSGPTPATTTAGTALGQGGNEILQQIIQGVVGQTTGMVLNSLGMTPRGGTPGGRGATTNAGNIRPPGPGLAFGGIRGGFAGPSVRGHLPRGIGVPMPTARIPAGFGVGRGGNNGGRGQRPGGGRGGHHHHPTPGHIPGIFVGPTPPSELPLYTIDHYLPCPSRHFDPRHVRGRQTQRNATDGNASPTSARPAADAQPEGTTNSSSASASATPPRTNAQEEAVGLRREEFESTLEQQLRPMVANMFTRHSVSTGHNHLAQMYNFQPVSFGAEGFGMTAVPIMMEDENEGSNNRRHGHDAHAEGAEPRHNNDSQSGNADSESADELYADAEEELEGAGGERNLSTFIAGVLQTLPGGGSDQTLSDFLRNLGMDNDTSDGSLRELYMSLASALTLRDLMQIHSGDVTPLDNNRPRIRRAIIEHILNGNDIPSEQDLHSAALRVTESGSGPEEGADEPEMANFLEGVEPREAAIDIVNSFQRCLQVAVEDILRIAFGFGDVPVSFGRSLYDRVRHFFREALVLGVRCCRNGQEDVEIIARRFLGPQLDRGGEGSLAASFRNSMTDQGVQSLRDLLNETEVSEADVERYVVRETPEMDTSSPPLPSDTVVEEAMVEGGAVVNGAVGPAPDSSSETPLASDRESWKRSLPPEWVRVIEEDVEKQKTQGVQGPLSDAYLCGLHAKRRKLLLEKRPSLSCKAEKDLRSSIGDAVRTNGVQPVTGESASDVVQDSNINEALKDAFDKEMDDSLRRRLLRDPDFDPEKFPNAKQYFKL